MKQILPITVLFFLFNCLIVFAQEVPKDLDYRITDNEVIIRRYEGTARTLIIPDTIEGLPVTTIGRFSFYMNRYLESIIIPDSVKRISDNAFTECRALTTVVLGNGVTVIEESAFARARNLTNINIPDSVTTIGNAAFVNSGIININIPAGVTEIGFEALAADNLESINVSADNKYFSSLDGILYNKDKTILIICPNGKEGSVIIPNSVTVIEDYAFSNCEFLTEIILPDGITRIGEWTFTGCKDLEKIDIPAGVTSIGEWAFYECISLTSVTIPDNVTKIEELAFGDCTALNNVIIGKSVEYIGEKAFSDCTDLVRVTFESKISEKNFASDAFPGNLRAVYFSHGGETDIYVRDRGSRSWRRWRAGGQI